MNDSCGWMSVSSGAAFAAIAEYGLEKFAS
jgi:hypothetical protein